MESTGTLSNNLRVLYVSFCSRYIASIYIYSCDTLEQTSVFYFPRAVFSCNKLAPSSLLACRLTIPSSETQPLVQHKRDGEYHCLKGLF